MHRTGLMNPTRHVILHLMSALAVTAIFLTGCSSTSTIQPVNSSNSRFDSAVYGGESVTISSNPGIEEFRVFHQGATGFVSVTTVRESVEKRATDFCDRIGKGMKPFRETTSKPPHILGNFPRVELIFGCIDKASSVTSSTADDVKYRKIANLKSLFDSGALTKEEFEREKAKILSQP
jgi:hypothetical protein